MEDAGSKRGCDRCDVGRARLSHERRVSREGVESRLECGARGSCSCSQLSPDVRQARGALPGRSGEWLLMRPSRIRGMLCGKEREEEQEHEELARRASDRQPPLSHERSSALSSLLSRASLRESLNQSQSGMELGLLTTDSRIQGLWRRKIIDRISQMTSRWCTGLKRHGSP